MRIDVKSSEAVKVYIGDGDDYIELNPLDVGFPLKIESTYKALDRETEKLKQELIILDKCLKALIMLVCTMIYSKLFHQRLKKSMVILMQ